MHSQINENLLVTKDQWAVSLIRIGFHAVIVVESMDDGGPDEGFKTRWFDFVTHEKPKQRHHHDNHLAQKCSDFSKNCSLLFKNIKGIAQNKIVEGKVRECPQFREPRLLDNGWMPDNSWQCDADKVRLMLEDIQKDKAFPPRLQYRGGPDSANCTTWCWEKLNKAGINARKETHCSPVTIISTHNMDITKVNYGPSM